MNRHIQNAFLVCGLMVITASNVTGDPPKPTAVHLTQVTSPPADPWQVTERHTALMGTDIDIMVAAPDSPEVQSAMDAAIAEISRIEELMTDWRDTSQVALINRFAGIKPVHVDTELLDLLETAARVSRLTDGAFDVTWKGAQRYWNLSDPDFKVPSPQEIAAAKAIVGYRRLIVDTAVGTAFLKDKGMMLGLGGIAKGYAVDRASAVLRERGFSRHVVNAGGDLYASGKHNGHCWQVGIKDPRKPQENIAILPVANMAVVTSGDYERFVEKDGVRYSHILDPRTGQPSQGCASVTVLATTATWADALATGVFVLGPTAGLALLESLPDVEGTIVDTDGKLLISSGLLGSR